MKYDTIITTIKYILQAKYFHNMVTGAHKVHGKLEGL